MASPPPSPPDWAGLPDDALLTVFGRLGAPEVLMGAGVVCRNWLRVATGEPDLWRRVDLSDCFDPTIDMVAMACAAVDRADGRLEHFAADCFVTDALLFYMAKRTNGLKSLRLVNCMKVSDKGLVALGKRSPHLEELELTTCSIYISMKAVGQAFPQLKRLRLNNRWVNVECEEQFDNHRALDIASNMPELRHLQLFANRLRNSALAAILDNCPHLESLDLRQCFNIHIDAELRAKCARLRDVRLPKDSTNDYDHEAYIETLELNSLPLLFAHDGVFTQQYPFHGSIDSDEDDQEDQDLDVTLGHLAL
ncbi:putative F-box/LRR-repeat protein 23 [Hordeum vulgare]|nr:putative F-box/LRR-repeat protein 23 [Hordeum vulgare]